MVSRNNINYFILLNQTSTTSSLSLFPVLSLPESLLSDTFGVEGGDRRNVGIPGVYRLEYNSSMLAFLWATNHLLLFCNEALR